MQQNERASSRRDSRVFGTGRSGRRLGVLRSFPLLFSIVLLGLTGLGFAKTFFLRLWFETYPVEVYVLWHGAAMTAWFVWLVVQTLLVAADRRRWHRTMGWVGVAIGCLAVVSAAGVNWAMLFRARRAGREVRSELANWADVLWSNAAPLAVFSVLFVAAVFSRRFPVAHARLMLLSSVAMLDPALARIGLLPTVELAGRTLDGWVFGLVVPAALPLMVLVWDWKRLRRVHPATLAGSLAVWAGIPFLRWFGAHTVWGHAVVAWFL